MFKKSTCLNTVSVLGASFILDKSHDLIVQCTASRSLTTFGHDPATVGDLLVRMAFTDNSPSSSAVLQSLLALASVHLYGLQDQAGELKLSALKALGDASSLPIGSAEAMQHVAAGMLLCSVEVFLFISLHFM